MKGKRERPDQSDDIPMGGKENSAGEEEKGGGEVCNRFLTILPPFYYKLFVLGGKKDTLNFQTFYFPSDPGGINFR